MIAILYVFSTILFIIIVFIMSFVINDIKQNPFTYNNKRKVLGIVTTIMAILLIIVNIIFSIRIGRDIAINQYKNGELIEKTTVVMKNGTPISTETTYIKK